MAIDSTYTDPGPPSDLVDRHGQALGGKYLFRGPQDSVDITACVGPQRAVRSHATGWRGDGCHIKLLDIRNPRSV